MPSTLCAPCEYQETIRKSRFLAKAAPVASPDEAQAFIQTVSDTGATHNCWAWKIGSQYRFSDDGEPGGTAGRPMLTAIEGQNCDQVAVVVIRWFGGIQLGTGGLARAYGGSAAKCLQAGERVELALLKARLNEYEALIESETFDAEGAELQLALPAEQQPRLQILLADISRGRIVLQLTNPTAR